MSGMPEEIVYGYRKVNIKPIKRSEAGLYGEYDKVKGEMLIATDVPLHEQVNTFLHEYFHFITETNALFDGIPNKHHVEERIVRVFANSFSELVNRNPEAAQWMFNGMKE